MSSYTENKQKMLMLARERKAVGFKTREFEDPGLVRTWVSELRRDGHRFVTFRVPSVSESLYALAEFTGTTHDGYAQLLAAHPEAHVKHDDQLPRPKRTGPTARKPSQPADQTQRSARRRAHEYRVKEKTAGELEIYMRGRRRLLESIENVTSISPLLMSSSVPAEDVESLVEDLTDLRAYADAALAYVQGKVEDAAFAERITKLRNVDGRRPEEAKAFLAMADKLECQRQQRLSA